MDDAHINGPTTLTTDLRIELLGGFAVTLNGKTVDAFRSNKARALLAYVAVEADTTHLRTTLASLLWDQIDEAAARRNLRIELSYLKQLLSAHPALEVTRNTVRFHSAAAHVDVAQFRSQVAAFHALSDDAQTACITQLANALRAYSGEFLAGFLPNTATGFQDWRLLTQEQLHQQAMHGLDTLQRLYRRSGRWPELAACARRQLALAPWLEPAHRNLIQALAVQGQRAAALRQYEECRRILLEELGVEPVPETRNLVLRIRTDRPAQPAPRHNLVHHAKTLVGRAEALQDLCHHIRSHRLVTIVGAGGVGKTHLAQTAAKQLLDEFADGVWFVPLQSVDPDERAADRVAIAIAAAVGFEITREHSPLAELLAYLADKHALLILDNWEQIVETADAVIPALLRRTPVRIIATSRRRLLLADEMLFALTGLDQAAAVDVFVAQARRVVPGFAATGQVEQIAQICRQVAGLPLGIELAAAWVEHFSVGEIAVSLHALAQTAPNSAQPGSPERHRSLRTVFSYSWQLLGPHQQEMLAGLSIFNGSFDRHAVTAVTGSSYGDLSLLLGHSLLQRMDPGRYALHPLIRLFAAEQLGEAEHHAVAMRHSAHYLTRLCETPRRERAAAHSGDIDNIRSAWQTAVTAGNAPLIAQATPHFGDYMARVGLMADGERLFQDAVDRFRADGDAREIVARLIDQQWHFARAVHGLRAASRLQLQLLDMTEDLDLQVKSHVELANWYAEEGKWDDVDSHLARVEDLTRDAADILTYVSAVERGVHIQVVNFRGNYGHWIKRLQAMLTLLASPAAASAPADQREDLRVRVRSSLGLTATRHGDYSLAMRYGVENLAAVDAITHQQQRVWILLDIALAEQFAGLYEAAVAHNEEALTMAEAIGAADDIGLLRANLCLTLRQQGEYERALRHGVAAADLLHDLGYARMEGQARNRIGHTFLVQQRYQEAANAYTRALAVWNHMEHPNRYEASAGKAAALVHLAEEREAVAAAEAVLAYISDKELDRFVEPVLLLLNCAEVFDAVGNRQQTRVALERAQQWVQTIAARISDPAVRAVYLHSRPDNRLLKARLTASAGPTAQTK